MSQTLKTPTASLVKTFGHEVCTLENIGLEHLGRGFYVNPPWSNYSGSSESTRFT